MRIFLLVMVCYCSFSAAWTQELTKELKEVIVEPLLLKEIPFVQRLEKKQIALLQPEDAGQLIQKFAGVSLKSYGGIGGMKTISVRGIGGNHTGIVVDGFTIQNMQTGQIDLSNIQAENIEQISLSMGGTDNRFLPVSALLGGSILQILTFENTFPTDTFQLRANAKTGSFGLIDSYLSAKCRFKKVYVSAFGKYRQANGNYPFQINNGDEIYQGTRTNNQLQEAFAGFTACFSLKKGQLKFNYQGNASQKGLPGAVILYNPTANQYLNNQSHQVNVSYFRYFRNALFRTYFSTRYEDLNYIDSGYLNQQGYLDQRYYNTAIQLGFTMHVPLNGIRLKNKPMLFIGSEQNQFFLSSSISNFEQAIRFQQKNVLGLEFTRKSNILLFQLGQESVFDHERTTEKAVSKYIFTPYVLWRKTTTGILGKTRLWVKRSFRMPTFNELYYNQIGNIHLKPEIANQANIGTGYEFNIHNNKFAINVDGYINLVENKIVAIPTKNLFIWSIQNVGKVQILGADLYISHSKNFSNIWDFRTTATYSFQQARDFTTEDSPTYKDQLPYLPKHTLNADFTCAYKKSGIGISALVTSERFALNENNASNRIAGFYTVDASIYHRFYLKKNHEFRLSCSVKNILNCKYAYVRYFVMPGTNFLISISYAFH